MKKLISILCLLMFVQQVIAVTEVSANGLFYGKAMLTIEGKQVLLEVGQTKRGVKLIEADEDHAVIRVDGKKLILYLDKSIAKEYSTPTEFKRHTDSKSHIINAQLIHQVSNLATFEVEYFYEPKELGDFVTLSAKTLFRQQDTGAWAHSYTRLTPGRKTIAITLSMGEKSPESYLSDNIQFDLVSNKGGEATSSGSLVLEFIKKWQR